MTEPADDEPHYVRTASAVTAVDEEMGFEDESSLVDQVKDLVEDTRTAIEAELAWQGARAGFVGRQTGSVAVWAGLALVCAFIAILSLAFGAILALTPMIGAIFATLAVVGALLVVALIAALLARSRVIRLKAVAFPAKPGAAS